MCTRLAGASRAVWGGPGLLITSWLACSLELRHANCSVPPPPGPLFCNIKLRIAARLNCAGAHSLPKWQCFCPGNGAHFPPKLSGGFTYHQTESQRRAPQRPQQKKTKKNTEKLPPCCHGPPTHTAQPGYQTREKPNMLWNQLLKPQHDTSPTHYSLRNHRRTAPRNLPFDWWVSQPIKDRRFSMTERAHSYSCNYFTPVKNKGSIKKQPLNSSLGNP